MLLSTIDPPEQNLEPITISILFEIFKSLGIKLGLCVKSVSITIIFSPMDLLIPKSIENPKLLFFFLKKLLFFYFSKISSYKFDMCNLHYYHQQL